MASEDVTGMISKVTKNDKFASVLAAIKNALPFFKSDKGGSNQLVGIDIGSDRIKIIKINSTKTPYIVEQYAVDELPKGAMTNDEIEDTFVISASIASLIKKQDIKVKYAAMALPRSLAIIKNVSVDKRLTDNDLESKAWVEANKSFPDLVGDIYLDYAITGPSMQDPEMQDLLLVASRKKHIQPYLELTQQAGLTAKIVDVDSYALFRVLDIIQQGTEDETVALLNLNLAQSSLIVSADGRLVHAHDQGFEGKKLMKQVHKYKQSLLAANGEVGALTINDAGYYDVLKENFISHLRHTVHFFYTSKPNIKMNKIYICGDCGTVPGLPEFIEKEIGIPTAMANPFENMEIGLNVSKEALMKNACSLVLATGLALSVI